MSRPSAMWYKKFSGNKSKISGSGTKFCVPILFFLVKKFWFCKIDTYFSLLCRYRDNMRQLSHIFQDRPMTPQQSVVYWTEYVIRHNGALHLRTAGADMPFYQYFLLDILAFVVAGATIVVFIIIYLIKKLHAIGLKHSKNAKHTPNKKKKN